MSHVRYYDNIVNIGSKSVRLPHKVLDAFESQGIIIIFLDPDANLGKTGQYHNLIGYDFHGTKQWEAELPTANKSDVYWKLSNKNPLIVYSFSSYECEIETLTGKILKKIFYK